MTSPEFPDLTADAVEDSLRETCELLGEKWTYDHVLVSPTEVSFTLSWTPDDEIMAPGFRIETYPCVKFTNEDEVTRWLAIHGAMSAGIGAIHLQYAGRKNVLMACAKAQGVPPSDLICYGKDGEVRIKFRSEDQEPSRT